MDKETKSTNRVYEMRQRRNDLGLKEIRNLWVHPDDFESLKTLAAKLNKRRKIKTKPA